MTAVPQFQTASESALPPGLRHQRVQGEARVSLGPRGLEGLRQAGSAKAIVLSGPEIVFLNTAGGLTGGDHLTYGLTLAAHTRAVATTQTAERLYRSVGGEAQIDVMLRLGAGAHLDWLPQETILFDRSAGHRRTEIDLADGAGCIALETLVLGREAMGETLQTLSFRDVRRFSRAGVPLHLEPLYLDAARLGAGTAVLAGARAVASLVLVGPGAADALPAARAALGEDGVRAGASGFDGRLVVRLAAAAGWPLRRQIARLLAALRRAPLPRVWQMQEVCA